MLYQLEKLNNSEKESVLNAPAYVTILIAGADDNIEDVEIKRSLQLIHTKTYSEGQDIRELYKELDGDFENRLNSLISQLPKTFAERLPIVEAELSKLNTIFTKIDPTVAHKFYKSLVNFATHVANTTGGVFGVGNISLSEQKYIHLPMLQDPKI